MDGCRKVVRLPNWDYSNAGCYFVTFCTHERKMTLGRVLEEPAEDGATILKLSQAGMFCQASIESIPERFPAVCVEDFVVMPNHVHLLCSLRATDDELQESLLSRVVGYTKSKTTRALREHGYKGAVWQRSFYDHVVRDEADYLRIMEYIENNPAKWAEDRFYLRSENS